MVKRIFSKRILFFILCGSLFIISQSSLAQNLKAMADLVNQKGETAGSVLFEGIEDGVKIKITITKLPAGLHAFHIHETGRSDPPDFKSAGGHFNPYKKEHGFLNPGGPHAGDLPNIYVKKDGTCDEEIISKRIVLTKAEKNSLFKEGGTAVMIHQNPDDYVTDPAGGGGTRIACGVIREMKEE